MALHKYLQVSLCHGLIVKILPTAMRRVKHLSYFEFMKYKPYLTIEGNLWYLWSVCWIKSIIMWLNSFVYNIIIDLKDICNIFPDYISVLFFTGIKAIMLDPVTMELSCKIWVTLSSNSPQQNTIIDCRSCEYISSSNSIYNSYLTVCVQLAHFSSRWLKGYIYSSCYCHHQIGSIHLSHCYHIFQWLCAWDVCYIIYRMLTIFACYVLTFMFGMLFLLLTTSLGCFCPRILLFE